MTKTIALLGTTGSIGRQTLQVARELRLRVAALAAGRQRGAAGSSRRGSSHPRLGGAV